MNTHKHRKMIGKINIDNNVYSTDYTFLGGGGGCWKKLTIYFQKGCINLIKSDKDVYYVTKYFYFK